MTTKRLKEQKLEKSLLKHIVEVRNKLATLRGIGKRTTQFYNTMFEAIFVNVRLLCIFFGLTVLLSKVLSISLLK